MQAALAHQNASHSRFFLPTYSGASLSCLLLTYTRQPSFLVIVAARLSAALFPLFLLALAWQMRQARSTVIGA